MSGPQSGNNRSQEKAEDGNDFEHWHEIWRQTVPIPEYEAHYAKHKGMEFSGAIQLEEGWHTGGHYYNPPGQSKPARMPALSKPPVPKHYEGWGFSSVWPVHRSTAESAGSAATRWPSSGSNKSPVEVLSDVDVKCALTILRHDPYAPKEVRKALDETNPHFENNPRSGYQSQEQPRTSGSSQPPFSNFSANSAAAGAKLSERRMSTWPQAARTGLNQSSVATERPAQSRSPSSGSNVSSNGSRSGGGSGAASVRSGAVSLSESHRRFGPPSSSTGKKHYTTSHTSIARPFHLPLG